MQDKQFDFRDLAKMIEGARDFTLDAFVLQKTPGQTMEERLRRKGRWDAHADKFVTYAAKEGGKLLIGDYKKDLAGVATIPELQGIKSQFDFEPEIGLKGEKRELDRFVDATLKLIEETRTDVQDIRTNPTLTERERREEAEGLIRETSANVKQIEETAEKVAGMKAPPILRTELSPLLSTAQRTLRLAEVFAPRRITAVPTTRGEFSIWFLPSARQQVPGGAQGFRIDGVYLVRDARGRFVSGRFFPTQEAAEAFLRERTM